MDLGDLTSVLKDLPPGQNVFDYILEMLDNNIFPELGRRFYIQAYVLAGLCTIIVLVILAATVIRWRKAGLKLLIYDGPATRPNPRVVVPLLWMAMGILLIIHSFWLPAAMRNHYLPYSLGLYLPLTGAVVACSYAFISASAMCSAPYIRRSLMRMNEGYNVKHNLLPSVILLNSFILAVCIATYCGVIPSARRAGRGFNLVNEGYANAKAILANAKEAQNLMALSQLSGPVAMLEAGKSIMDKGSLAAGYAFSAYCIAHFFFGLIPGLALNIFMRKRINRLAQAASTGFSNSAALASTAQPAVGYVDHGRSQDNDFALETLAQPNHKSAAELLKDRPFANLAQLPTLPPAYATIFKSDVAPQEKAKRLSRALKRDNIQLGAYFMMLGSMGSLGFYQLSGAATDLNAKDQLIVALTWELWSYLAPALVLSAAYLWDSINYVSSVDEVAGADAPTLSFRRFQAPQMTAIQLSQTVEVVEEHQMHEKKEYRMDSYA